MIKLFVVLGSINAFLAVALGAFGAHGLRGKLSTDMMAIYQTSVQYHMYHALGLVFVGILAYWLSPSIMQWAGWFMFFGILLFSGSLYTLSMTGIKWLGAITPLGGVGFLLGWIFIVIAALR